MKQAVTSFLSELWYWTIYTISSCVTTTCFGLRMERRHPVPETGPLLVVANHQSFLDPPLVGLVTGRPLVYLARKTLFRSPVFRRFIKSLNAVPIDQDGVGKEGLKTIIEELAKGRAVLVFPEGSRTPDGKMHELKPGIHLLLKRSQAAILPVGIAGAYESWPIWRKLPIPCPLFLPSKNDPVAVVVGKIIPPERLAPLSREEALKVVQDEIQKVQTRAEEIRRRR